MSAISRFSDFRAKTTREQGGAFTSFEPHVRWRHLHSGVPSKENGWTVDEPDPSPS